MAHGLWSAKFYFWVELFCTLTKQLLSAEGRIRIWMWRQSWVGAAGRGETIIRIYFMIWKKCIFNKRKNFKNVMGTMQTLKTKSEVRGKSLQIMGQFLSRHFNDLELECLGKFADSHKWSIYTFHRELQGRDQCDWWVLFDRVLVQALLPTLDCTHGGHEECMVAAQRFTIRWPVPTQAVFFIGDLWREVHERFAYRLELTVQSLIPCY